MSLGSTPGRSALTVISLSVSSTSTLRLPRFHRIAVAVREIVGKPIDHFLEVQAELSERVV